MLKVKFEFLQSSGAYSDFVQSKNNVTQAHLANQPYHKHRYATF